MNARAAFTRANERVRENLPREHGWEPAARVDGAIPDWIDATLYRNGPGLQERFGQKYGHAFEGDGGIVGVRVARGRAELATRLVRTREFEEEERRGRLLYGMGVSWFQRVSNAWSGRSKSPANVNVVAWQSKLLAMPEGSPPYVLDPNDLSTQGALEVGDVAPGYHSAHPHRVEERSAYYSFRLIWGRQTELSVLCYPDSGAPHEIARVPLSGAVYFHDCIVTRDHLIVFIPPVRVNIFRAITRIGPFRRLFEWRPELGTEILVIPLDAPHEPVHLHTEPLHVWHFANAFSTDEGLSVDFSYWPDFSSFDAVGDADYETTSDPELRRAHLNLKERSVRLETLTDLLCEFPSVPPQDLGRPTQRLWCQTETTEQTGVLSYDADGQVERFLLEPGQIVSEPNFLPKPGGAHGEGVLSSLCYDLETHTSFLALFDALHVEDGPVARVWFDHHLPMTFHGCWVPTV